MLVFDSVEIILEWNFLLKEDVANPWLQKAVYRGQNDLGQQKGHN